MNPSLRVIAIISIVIAAIISVFLVLPSLQMALTGGRITIEARAGYIEDLDVTAVNLDIYDPDFPMQSPETHIYVRVVVTTDRGSVTVVWDHNSTASITGDINNVHAELINNGEYVTAAISLPGTYNRVSVTATVRCDSGYTGSFRGRLI
ncbi:MAG: hypothetical protein B6D63_01715 [Candidatus Latescibacteria bacterium 4484_7]|nr:MAG: hypothetical protein B6D63_01715 [Candidatus Latescibacteria bacterium 4484_7]